MYVDGWSVSNGMLVGVRMSLMLIVGMGVGKWNGALVCFMEDFRKPMQYQRFLQCGSPWSFVSMRSQWMV